MNSSHEKRDQLADENAALRREAESLRDEIGKLRNENEQLKQLVGTDYLTHIANRRSFEQELARRLAQLNRHGGTFCVLMFDIDHFKAVNDQLGHAAGDRLLQQIAQRLSSETRESDFVARYGGDEFSVLLPEADLQLAKLAGRRVIDFLLPLIRDESQALPQPLAISMGVSPARSGMSAEDLIANVDRALYKAKQKPGSQVVAVGGEDVQAGSASESS